MDDLIACIKKGDRYALADQYGDPMTALSDALRGMFTAGPGKTLQTADFTAIEGRGTAWVAGEEWKLEAFRRGEDIYCSTASMVYGYPVIDKKSHPRERGVGKVCELAFGYQGAVGAWRGFDKSDKYTDAEVMAFCRTWRSKHPATVALWRGLERAAGRAVMTGKPQHYSCVTYETVVDRAGKWLTCILPNGRRLWYYDPECDVEDAYWGPRYHVTYEGRNNHRGGKWDRIAGYGGLWTENFVQAFSRDVLVEAMFRIEYGGYPIVLTVHDDAISEVAPNFGSQKEFDALMMQVPTWAPGLPIDVDGWRGFRLHKD
jgi:DNA polymerase